MVFPGQNEERKGTRERHKLERGICKEVGSWRLPAACTPPTSDKPR